MELGVNKCQVKNGAYGDFFRCLRQQFSVVLTSYSVAYQQGELTREGAEDDAIKNAEERVGLSFPDQLKRFYQFSDGYLYPEFDGELVERLSRVEEVGKLVDRFPDVYDDWTHFGWSDVGDEEYFVYGEEQEPYTARFEYLKNTIAISDEGSDGEIVLLNPEVQFDSEEYEIWVLAPHLSGAIRYRGFQEFLEEDNWKAVLGIIEVHETFGEQAK